jgi:hypothetical protein
VVKEGWEYVINSVPRIGEFTEDLGGWSPGSRLKIRKNEK